MDSDPQTDRASSDGPTGRSETITIGNIARVETVAIPSIPSATTDKPSLPEIKAFGAREVARVLVYTFAATIAGAFLIAALIFGLSASPSQARDFVKVFVDMVPVMENFVTKVFGPLLAFVLGYYFGEKGATTPTK